MPTKSKKKVATPHRDGRTLRESNHQQVSVSLEKGLVSRIHDLRETLYLQQGIEVNQSQLVEMALREYLPHKEKELGLNEIKE